jgi:hypothetical protein
MTYITLSPRFSDSCLHHRKAKTLTPDSASTTVLAAGMDPDSCGAGKTGAVNLWPELAVGDMLRGLKKMRRGVVKNEIFKAQYRIVDAVVPATRRRHRRRSGITGTYR